MSNEADASEFTSLETSNGQKINTFDDLWPGREESLGRKRRVPPVKVDRDTTKKQTDYNDTDSIGLCDDLL